MRALRFRIAAVLVASIVAVVGIITAVAVFFIVRPSPERLIHPVAGQIAAIYKFYDERGRWNAQDLAGDVFYTTHRPEGALDASLSADLQQTLDRQGMPIVAQVFEQHEGDYVAAVPVGQQGWLQLSFPPEGLPPPEFWWPLIAWIIAILAGTITVSLTTVFRLTQPFLVLEEAVAQIGPEGILPRLPEGGGSKELQAFSTTLNRLSERLRSAMDGRMRLVAAAGHDLRTPMTRMRLRAEFLPDEDREGWNRDLDELEQIADSAIMMVREEAAEKTFEPIRLDEVVVQTLDELLDTGLNLKLVARQAVTVLAGPLALRRALRNLMTNAATHGIVASVAIEGDADTARVIIEDEGPGLAEDMLEQVFEPFFRATGESGVPGMGLGLAISRQLIERFGGSVALANRPEGGLRQVITLPRMAARGADSSRSERLVFTSRRGR